MKSGTNVNNSSRRQKNKSLDLVDGISALPDAILGLILSFLPTKEAVATAFLSKRWKFLWRNVHNLDFCHQDWIKSLCSENENMKFVQFVDHVLLLHDVGLLYKFRLEWNHDQISSSHVNSWISNAITRNVHEISLFTELYVRPFEIPVSVFSCDSLRSLELYEIYVPAVDVICLPRLEILKLVCTGFQSEEEFEKLISKCPMLNFLHLEADVVYMEDLGISAEFAYVISSTSVKRLELSFVSESAVDDTDNSLMLKASSLEYLKLEGFIARISVPKTLSSLVEADIRIELPLDEPTSEEFCNSIVEAVDAFCWVKALTLSADATWALSFGTISLRSMFKRLVKLEATIYCCYHRALQDLIENSYNLEVLTVHQRASYDGTMTSNHDDHTPWTAPEIAQICLSNSLKKVVMDSYYDYENVREMIRYILKHGSVLEEMHIYCSRQRPDTEKLTFVHEICKFPRKSPFCEVEISYTG